MTTAPAPQIIARCSPWSRPSPPGGLRPALTTAARRHEKAATRSGEENQHHAHTGTGSHKTRRASNPGCSTGEEVAGVGWFCLELVP
jgi:hypothetical protein